MPTNGNLKVT